MLNQYAYTRTVSLLDGSAVAQNEYGDDVGTWAVTDLPGCVWWPSSTTENLEIGSDVTTSRYSLLMPYGATHASGRPPSSVDRVILPGEAGVWQIDGEPRAHTSPITGAVGGLQAWLVKVSG